MTLEKQRTLQRIVDLGAANARARRIEGALTWVAAHAGKVKAAEIRKVAVEALTS